MKKVRHNILAAVNQDEGTHTHTHTMPVLLGVYVLACMSVYLHKRKTNTAHNLSILCTQYHTVPVLKLVHGYHYCLYHYCAHQYCASVALDQIETTFLDFLHPLIWLSVNHVSLSNLSCQLSNMLTFATIHFDTILCHTLFSPTICMYCMLY